MSNHWFALALYDLYQQPVLILNEFPTDPIEFDFVGMKISISPSLVNRATEHCKQLLGIAETYHEFHCTAGLAGSRIQSFSFSSP